MAVTPTPAAYGRDNPRLLGRRPEKWSGLRVWVETPGPPVLGKERYAEYEYIFGERPIPDIGSGGFVFELQCVKEAGNCIQQMQRTMTLHDKFGRQITDLRISITDRCNFRCVYCRSADPENYRDHDEILSWPELDRLAKIFLRLGIRKIRITGGEPLVREGVEDYIARLHALGVVELSMTTNGHLLAERCDRLLAAGLRRVHISLDSLDPDRHWTRDVVVPAAEVHQRIHASWPLVQIPHERSETARKYRFADGAPGEIGLIAPVTQPFCGHCSRIRLTADGKLRTCLFSKDDHDLRSMLREGASDEDLITYITSIVMEKEEGHRINEPGFVPPSRTMVFIGG